MTVTSQQTAAEISKINGIATAPRRAKDTAFGEEFPCYIVMETERAAVVIYDDEPECVVSTANHQGRFAAW